ncbi:Omp28-related outer membrane protein [Cryomorpha ignava]|uniref:Omp28-related outer membrane protein n=1 Tax=Cryomorpha ignava TaxID=101383 RepID=A0A7K3WJQ7_9FLAO|nr:Omp28-related outer membrane protein [Cryomorpha ignava]NEN21890.1 Omp28-related outer membrane protein [Cryomorpha ignava]
MKNLFTFVLLLTLGTVFFSCQDAEDDCIYVDKRRCDPDFVLPDITGTDTTSTDSTDGIITLASPITNYDEKILLEDFTGFRCTNCVPATVTAVNLKAAHPNRLSIVGVHCTPFFAAPLTSDTTQPYHSDFRTPEGEQFFDYYEMAGLPNGAINRLGSQGNKYIPFAEWTDRINALIAENNPEVYISIENITVDEENQELIVKVYAKPLIPSETAYLINLSVTESGIADAQKNSSSPGGQILDYVHNHVYRGSAYGPWGIDVFNGNIDLNTNEVLSLKLKIDINTEWNLENCEILVFISKSSNREVVQVEEAHIL